VLPLVRSPVSLTAPMANASRRNPWPQPGCSRARPHAGTDELLVCVYDEREDAYFELRPQRNVALDAYYHPYAYVACRERLAA